jgi:hypothetical protein
MLLQTVISNLLTDYLDILIIYPDNILTVMQGPSLDNAIFFTLTAILLAIIDGLGSWKGAIAIRRMAKIAP